MAKREQVQRLSVKADRFVYVVEFAPLLKPHEETARERHYKL